LAIRRELVEPDPLRLAYRNLIKEAVRRVVLEPGQDPVTLIRQEAAAAEEKDRENVQALITEELRRIHEGVLARYGLRPSELAIWLERQSGRS
jgi:hypothetical protein